MGVSLPDIASLLSDVAGIVNNIYGVVTQGATAQQVDVINARLGEIQQSLAVINLNAQNAAVASSADLQIDNEILNRMRNLVVLITAFLHVDPATQQLTVNIPTTPPPGYGSSGASASDVWAYVEPGADRSQGYYQVLMGLLAQAFNSSQVMVPVGGSGLLMLQTQWGEPHSDMAWDDVAHPDPTAILSTDTLGGWLNRTSGVTWTRDSLTHFYNYTFESSAFTVPAIVWCTLTDGAFEALKATSASATVFVPPVWPGIDAVTLGSEVPLVDQGSVDGPMSGVIVRVASADSGRSHLPYGDHQAILHIGALTFEADNGAVEAISLFNFDSQIICCKQMVQASKVWTRAYSGVSATIQPWSMAG